MRFGLIRHSNVRHRLVSLLIPFSARLYGFLKLIIMPYEQFSSFVPKKGIIIDNGCGYGYTSLFLALESNERRIIGIDPSSNRVKRIPKIYSALPDNVSFETKDIRDLKVKEVDGIVMEQVLHHIPREQHQTVLKEVYAKLKPGGTFVIRENKKRLSLKFFVNFVFEYLFYFFDVKGNFYREKELVRLLQEIGFRCKTIPCPWHYLFEISLVICKK